MKKGMPSNEHYFESVLRKIFNGGEYFCNPCMNMLSSHYDVDKIITDTEQSDKNQEKDDSSS